MIKNTALVIILALRLAYQPYANTTNFAAFATEPAKLISFKASIQQKKIFLQWSVNENQSADNFTIEKSADGRNFQVAALAFGSDTPGLGEYKFYEKAGNRKTSYRIKLVNKDQKVEYSDIIIVDPSV